MPRSQGLSSSTARTVWWWHLGTVLPSPAEDQDSLIPPYASLLTPSGPPVWLSHLATCTRLLLFNIKTFLHTWHTAHFKKSSNQRLSSNLCQNRAEAK